MSNSEFYTNINGLVFVVIVILTSLIMIVVSFLIGILCIMACEVGKVWRKQAVDMAKVRRFWKTSAPPGYLPD